MDLVPDLGRQVLGVEALFHLKLGWKGLADRLRQALRIDRMRRDRPEGLEIHDEAIGCPLGPELHLLWIRERVVRRVVLDHREPFGIEPQSLVGFFGDLLGIPAGRDERGIGPAAGSDLDARPVYSAFSG